MRKPDLNNFDRNRGMVSVLGAGEKPLQPLKIARARLVIVVLAFVAGCGQAVAQGPSGPSDNGPRAAYDATAALPDAPSTTQATQRQSFAAELGTAAKTIGSDELNILKAPFSSKKALIWDALAVGSTSVLIANDESVLYQVNPAWHHTSINISNGTLYGLGGAAGGIFVAGLVKHDPHATDTGIKAAEASVDSVILYAALKAVLQRQRPGTYPGEGKFFSGNWNNGSFPSGHSTLAWTLAAVMAHEYPNWPMRILMYGAATAVSTTRVTAGVHFPGDVWSGAIIGLGVGTFVAHKEPYYKSHTQPTSKLKRVPDAIVQHLTIGAP